MLIDPRSSLLGSPTMLSLPMAASWLPSDHHITPHAPSPLYQLLASSRCALSYRAMMPNSFLHKVEQPAFSPTTKIKPKSGRNGFNYSRKSCTTGVGHAVCFRDESSALSSAADTVVSCTTFNILAPIYKRIGSEARRESQFRESWLRRNKSILEMLLLTRSSIICLQEFWLGNEELVHLYEDNLGHVGYYTYKLARTNNRGDGLLTAISSETLRVLNYKEILFDDSGDRVAQLFHLCFRRPFYKKGQKTEQELLLVNTHLMFPHNFTLSLIRLRQVYKIIEDLEHFKMEINVPSIPVILCGDWNGSKRGQVYKFLRSQGFSSAYDAAHSYSDTDAHQWVSHRNHLGNICAVDFIWLLNPSSYRKPLSVSWKEAVLGIITAKLCDVGLKGKDAFGFFKSKENGNHVTLHEFQSALKLLQLGVTENSPGGLSRREIEDLMQTIDVDGNGVIGYSEFANVLTAEASISKKSRLLASSPKPKGHMRLGKYTSDAVIANKFGNGSQQKGVVEYWKNKGTAPRVTENQGADDDTGIAIQDAFLFPPEVEHGFWPEDYSLSDHALLTAIFVPLGACNRQSDAF